jgi:hypothetical protein
MKLSPHTSRRKQGTPPAAAAASATTDAHACFFCVTQHWGIVLMNKNVEFDWDCLWS